MSSKFTLSILIFQVLFIFTTYQTPSNWSSFRKHKSGESEEDVLSRRICFDSDVNFRYHTKTDECYKIGSKGPCGQNMIFFAQENNTIYGNCDCTLSGRTLIYHEETNQCYFIFKQAYCREGEWLTLSTATGKPLCERNPCNIKTEKSARHDELVPFKNRCVKLGAPASECNRYDAVDFVINKILPRCTNSAVNFALGGISKIAPCSPGSFRSISGGCQQSWVW